MTGFLDFAPASIDLGTRRFAIRRATEADLPRLVALLRDDILGAGREVTSAAPADGDVADLSAYEHTFGLIDADPNQLLVAVEEITAPHTESNTPPSAQPHGPDTSAVVGTLQLSLVHGLSRQGSTRLQIEAVRIGAEARGTGLGTAVFEWAHDCGRRFGASLAQLTTDKSRTDAHRFYDRLGYVASHEGYKLPLD